MTRHYPRISVNKLAEYLIGKPSRRRKIVANQKNPPDFIVAYYQEAEDIICDYIVNNREKAYIASQMEQLSTKPASSEWNETRLSLCYEALDAFIEIIDEITFSDFEKERGDKSQEKICINDVDISVRPEIFLQKDGETVGAVKFIFSKNRNAEQEEIDYIGAMLYKYMQDKFNPGIRYQDCFVVDIFAPTIAHSPKAYKRRMNEITEACDEIKDMWKRV